MTPLYTILPDSQIVDTPRAVKSEVPKREMIMVQKEDTCAIRREGAAQMRCPAAKRKEGAAARTRRAGAMRHGEAASVMPQCRQKHAGIRRRH